MIGQSLLHYEVLDKLGSGGMGVVYRARDTKLGRDVAIKILPAAFSKDKERLGRFEREARLLASLNHPNIATIHDLEESDGVHFLVLELVEGETLAERIKRGPIPVDETLPLFKQIAEALEAAHEKGIIHRDLKPANIKVTPGGKAKVLDFGLAKAMAGEATERGLSESPTMTRAATEAGILLGTAPYMSPEQARGKAVDKRVDVWAFGCCLYEALTGKAAFLGETVTDTIAKIVEREPDWETLPVTIPVLVRSLLRRCLHKDPTHRLQHIGDARVEIEEAVIEPVAVGDIREIPRSRKRRAVSWTLAALAALAVGVTVWYLRPPAAPRPVSRFSFLLPPGDQFTETGDVGRVVALSPDGKNLVYMARRGGRDQLYLRQMDRMEATPLQGSEGARNPFFSPDGQWVGFWTEGQLRKVSVSGGAPVTLCDAENPHGISWGADDMILYGQGLAGISRVAGTGGTPEVVIAAEEGEGDCPQMLPGGEWVLFTWAPAAASSWNDAQIVVQSVATGERVVLIEGGRDARYVSTGHLVYGLNGVLFAVAFDLDARAVIGGPVGLVEGVRDARWSTGAMHFSVASNGSLVYVPLAAEARTLVWVDREGREEPVGAPPRPYYRPRVSPDGTRLAVEVEDPANRDVWIYDLARGTSTRLTFDEAEDTRPLWTPNGERVVFGSTREGARNLFWRAADATGPVERLTTSPHLQSPNAWAGDGQQLIFMDSGGGRGLLRGL